MFPGGYKSMKSLSIDPFHIIHNEMSQLLKISAIFSEFQRLISTRVTIMCILIFIVRTKNLVYIYIYIYI